MLIITIDFNEFCIKTDVITSSTYNLLLYPGDIIIIIIIIHTKISGTCTDKTLKFFCVLEKLTVQAISQKSKKKQSQQNSSQ